MPARKSGKSSTPVTAEEERINAEATRLRSRAERRLLQKAAPGASTSAASIALRRCDGADIVKRNANRKKKYLFVFPGAASLPPGATVGSLSGLDTRTPTLDVDVPPHGRIRLLGSLVFPKNCFTAVKVPASKKKPVNVVATFETLVVFSEWAWVGDPKKNPGGLPEPLPLVLKRPLEEGKALWKSCSTQDSELNTGPANRKEKAGGGGVGKSKVNGAIVLDDDTDEVENVADNVIELDDEDEDEDAGSWDQWESTFSMAAAQDVEPRSNPRRKRKRINYADDEEEDMDSIDRNTEGGTAGGRDESRGTPDANDDDPGYNAEADLIGTAAF